MSFRLRLTLLTALAVAVAIVATSLAVYYTDRREQYRQVDSDLASTLELPQLKTVVSGPVPPFGPVEQVGTRGYLSGGAAVKLLGKGAPNVFRVVLPRSSTAVQVRIARRAKGSGPVPLDVKYLTADVKGVPTRMLYFTSRDAAVTVSRSLFDVDRSLTHLRWMLFLISVAGIGAAAILGAFVSGRAMAPLRRLTETTEQIVETGDLSRRTGQRGRDEISRLSTRLDELLAGLEASLDTQRQLVADASHELRTPIATLRANIGLLGRPDTLVPEEREELIDDVQGELEAMTDLVTELVELARGEEPDVVPTEFRLDEVVKCAVSRAARRSPELRFATKLEPSTVTGVPERVERAVSNLLDNARKWSPSSGTIDVTVHDGLVEVRDRGPGIAEEDRPLVFNRFYRAKGARGMPGAGLGLSIVKQIADAHGGSVTVDRAPDGGAILRLQLSPTR
jgi:two-component system, OmpR family, sensor histidine kinase MprB